MSTDYFEPETAQRLTSAPPEHLVDIRVNGIVLGTVDVRTLPGRAQFDLEDATGAYDLLEWLRTYAGVPEEALPQIRDELATMNISAIVELAMQISEAIGAAISLPNTNRPRWRQRSNTAMTRRSGR